MNKCFLFGECQWKQWWLCVCVWCVYIHTHIYMNAYRDTYKYIHIPVNIYVNYIWNYTHVYMPLDCQRKKSIDIDCLDKYKEKWTLLQCRKDFKYWILVLTCWIWQYLIILICICLLLRNSKFACMYGN